MQNHLMQASGLIVGSASHPPCCIWSPPTIAALCPLPLLQILHHRTRTSWQQVLQSLMLRSVLLARVAQQSQNLGCPALQVLALIAMEKPVSGNADDIRDEKVKVIRCISPAKIENCVLGQYAAANGKPGYHDDDTVPKDSKSPTFANIVLNIHNERWQPCLAAVCRLKHALHDACFSSAMHTMYAACNGTSVQQWCDIVPGDCKPPTCANIVHFQR